MVKPARNSFLAAGLIAAWSLAAAGNAEAALIVAGTFGGVDFCAADQSIPCGFGIQLPDTDPTVGSLAFGSGGIIIDGIEINGALEQAIFGPPQNILSSSSIGVTNLTGSPVTGVVSVGATGFQGPSVTATTSGSGTFVSAVGATILMNWCNDPSNVQHGTTPQDCGPVIDTFSTTATLDPFSFSHNGGPFAVNDPAVYSMGLQFIFTLPGGGQLISRGQSEIKPTAGAGGGAGGGQAIPEPVSVTLLGVGLAGLGARRLRHRRS